METKTEKKKRPSRVQPKKSTENTPKRKYKYLRGYRELVDDPWGLNASFRGGNDTEN